MCIIDWSSDVCSSDLMAKLNFIYDSARVGKPPDSIPALLDWAKAHPGRFTYPAPPDFLGSTFLKQVLIELSPDPSFLQQPVESEAQVEEAARPLWEYLDALHPHLWRGGDRSEEQTSELQSLMR